MLWIPDVLLSILAGSFPVAKDIAKEVAKEVAKESKMQEVNWIFSGTLCAKVIWHSESVCVCE